MWVLFSVPCPTPDGRSARDLYDKRVRMITPAMQASARARGCRFHQAWHVADGSFFHALACWDSRESARAFFTQWGIEDEPGETATFLEGQVGLVLLMPG